MAKKKALKKIEVIHWVDAAHLSGSAWHNQEEISKLSLDEVVSVGWVVEDNKDYLILVSSHSMNQFSGEVCVPVSCVKSRHELVAKDA